MKVGFRWLCAIAAGMTLGGYSVPARAAPVCEGPPAAVLPFLPELPKGCQKERIQASGELSFNVFRKATRMAETAWQREVITKYGERFQDLRFAACKNVLCEKGAVSGTERCTISAYPCASDMGETARAAVERLASLDDQNVVPDDLRRFEEKREASREQRREEKRIEGEEKKMERELNPREVREMQRLLRRAGYKIQADGIFGDESRDALSAYERRAGLPDDGFPTYEMLERLRKDYP